MARLALQAIAKHVQTDLAARDIECLCQQCLGTQVLSNKYFELKNSWGAGAPLKSNYLLLLLYCSHPYYMNP